MNKSIYPVATGLCMSFFSILSASTSAPFFDQPPPTNFHISGGYREDTFHFRISGADGVPETYSIAKWKNLRIAQISAWYDNSTSCCNYYFRVNGDYGRILYGRGGVSNFEEGSFFGSSSSSSGSSSSDDDESFVYSHQDSDANKGCVGDVAAGVGWKVISGGGRCWIAGLGGWSYSRQSLHMNNFEQEVDVFDLVGIGKVQGLRGKYKAGWSGPWLGIDFSTMIECDVTVFGSAEWHWAKYEGNGRWSYLDDYHAHIRHNARGYGIVGMLGFDWAPCDRWAIGVMGNYQQWSTRKGRNRDYIDDDLSLFNFVDLTTPVVEESNLRRAKWYSYSISALVSYRY